MSIMDRRTALLTVLAAVNVENLQEILDAQGVERIITAETDDEDIALQAAAADGDPEDLREQMTELRDLYRAIAVLSEELK